MNFIKIFIFLTTVTIAKGSFQNEIEIEKVEPGFIRENLGKGVAIKDYLHIIFKYNLTSFNIDHISNLNSTYNLLCDKYKEHFNNVFRNCYSNYVLKKKIDKVIKKYKFLISHNKYVDENVSGQKRGIRISQIDRIQQKTMQELDQNLKFFDKSNKIIDETQKNIIEHSALLKNIPKTFDLLKNIAEEIEAIRKSQLEMTKFFDHLITSVEATLESIENLIEIIDTSDSNEFFLKFVTISELKSLLASIELKEEKKLAFEINKIHLNLIKSLFKFQKKNACFLNEVNESDKKAKAHCKLRKTIFDGFKVENLPIKNALLVITNTEKTFVTGKIGTRKRGLIKLTKGSHILRSKSLIELNFNDAYYKFGENDFLSTTFDKSYVNIPMNFSIESNLIEKDASLLVYKAEMELAKNKEIIKEILKKESEPTEQNEAHKTWNLKFILILISGIFAIFFDFGRYFYRRFVKYETNENFKTEKRIREKLLMQEFFDTYVNI
ncbi:hypothetical protein PVAND_016814 [Polypedilum vanderplanki]|uniref:Uncharacterized protein n=1 Tax=Polypedilum vanderplanki TaxID=319348 RepID=A0A9J6BGW4_POLVA|nr:hypothetical protein PVAND_016814 [Polypedilum vanderplanki]